MFRFAWHALKTKYGSPTKWLTSVGTVADNYYCGHTFAQHHPNGSIAFLHGGLLKTITREVMIWHKEFHGGIFQSYKRSKYDEVHGWIENVYIKWDGAEYLPNRPADIKIASCTDMAEITARPLDEILPGFEATYEEIGGYWMLE
jgi:alpha 1,2-mannosyltransferase